MQWKPDWAMRWYAFDVDYEPAGKDLTDSVTLASRIVQALGKKPPVGLIYELFLDDKGEKISKSKGNGLSIEEWLTYATPESLALYMFQQPKRAKKLYFDVIPKATDEYLTFVEKYHDLPFEQQVESPVHHIHQGNVPSLGVSLSFNMLLNLVSAADASDEAILWGFIMRYSPEASPEKNPYLNTLVGYAIRYYHDFIAPHKSFRQPTDTERAALIELKEMLSALALGTNSDDVQTAIFTVGKNHHYENLRDWFGCLYETLLGQAQGPRMGSFAVLYGFDKTIQLIDKALSRI
jgi:lysyl-tRNA synthetase class 1